MTIPKTQNDYLREWVPKKKSYLDRVLSLEGPGGPRICIQCKAEAEWRCKDCFGRPLTCTDCCRDAHKAVPFHRIERWAGTFYKDAWLVDVGLSLHLGHGGAPCPVGLRGEFDDLEDEGISMEEELPPDEEIPAKARFFEDLGYTAGNPNREIPSLVIVHNNGVHRLPVYWCRCIGHAPDEFQLLDIGMVPASFLRIHTAFTFHVLDDFLTDNLECKTSAMHYFQKLRKLTSPSFPQSVPDRYRELMRVSREWRHLKTLKWYGFGHEEREPGPGELATFCPACPQPGINLPPDWRERPHQCDEFISYPPVPDRYSDRVLYCQRHASDGNFKAMHQKQKNPQDDVFLTDGTGFMTERAPYEEHVRKAPKYRDVSGSCPTYVPL